MPIIRDAPRILEGAAGSGAACSFDEKRRGRRPPSLGNPDPDADTVAALLVAYKNAVDNIPDRKNLLPVHHAEENMSNLSAVSSRIYKTLRLDNLRYVHSKVPHILSAVNKCHHTLLQYLLHLILASRNPVRRAAASDILRYLYLYLYITRARQIVVIVVVVVFCCGQEHSSALQKLNYRERRSTLLCFFRRCDGIDHLLAHLAPCSACELLVAE